MAEHRPSTEQKRRVEGRARGCCEYCRSQACFAVASFSVEHIDPEGAEGGDDLNNLALACQGCNNHKYTKREAIDPNTGRPAPLFHPRQQRWEEHFAWSADFTRVIGLTPTGRATVAALFQNREGVVNLRMVLFAIGKQPPETTGKGNGAG